MLKYLFSFTQLQKSIYFCIINTWPYLLVICKTNHFTSLNKAMLKSPNFTKIFKRNDYDLESSVHVKTKLIACSKLCKNYKVTMYNFKMCILFSTHTTASNKLPTHIISSGCASSTISCMFV